LPPAARGGEGRRRPGPHRTGAHRRPGHQAGAAPDPRRLCQGRPADGPGRGAVPPRHPRRRLGRRPAQRPRPPPDREPRRSRRPRPRGAATRRGRGSRRPLPPAHRRHPTRRNRSMSTATITPGTTQPVAPSHDTPVDLSTMPRISLWRLTRVELRKMANTRSGTWLLIGIASITLIVIVAFYASAAPSER